MLAHIWNLDSRPFLINSNPAGSEVLRIKSTIESLRQTEDTVFRTVNGKWTYPGSIYQDALELCWTWRELNKRVSLLPDSFFEKHIWLAEIKEGIQKSQSFLQQNKRILP